MSTVVNHGYNMPHRCVVNGIDDVSIELAYLRGFYYGTLGMQSGDCRLGEGGGGCQEARMGDTVRCLSCRAVGINTFGYVSNAASGVCGRGGISGSSGTSGAEYDAACRDDKRNQVGACGKPIGGCGGHGSNVGSQRRGECGVAGVSGRVQVVGAGAGDGVVPGGCESVLGGGTDGSDTCVSDGASGFVAASEDGRVRISGVSGGDETTGVCERVCADAGDAQGVEDVAVVCGQESVKPLGKHYQRNRRRRLQRRVAKTAVPEWRRGAPGSICGGGDSVVTVSTKTAEELEAVKSLALRRVAENKVAIALAVHKLAAVSDKDKTDAVERLSAARMEQRINEAKAKSQASFKKCDESLKSLGSAGSAGEYALKKEVQQGLQWKRRYDDLGQQFDVLFKRAQQLMAPKDFHKLSSELAEFPELHLPDADQELGVNVHGDTVGEQELYTYEEMLAEAAKFGL